MYGDASGKEAFCLHLLRRVGRLHLADTFLLADAVAELLVGIHVDSARLVVLQAADDDNGRLVVVGAGVPLVIF